MAINKLTEFASSGLANKDTTGLDIPSGFPKNIQPARQWFNYLFNSLTTKINEIIDKKLNLSGGSLTGAINEAAGAAIASASTVDLTNATGNFVHITGTTTITAINLVQGASRRVVFDGILTLTNRANLILPGGADITTAAGDSAIFVGDALGVVRCIVYFPASGKPVVLPSATTLAPGIVQLNNTLTSTSTTQALSAAQGKVLNDGKLNITDFQKQTAIISAASGTDDAITASYTPAITALTNGMSLFVRAASANTTTTPTFTPNSGTIAAKTIVKGAGSALVAGDIAGGGHWIELQYDATLDKWVLLNPATGVFGTTVNNTLTSTSTTQALSAAQGKVLNDQAFGVGQTWQDVTSSRVKNTTYTNTSGKAIQVCISLPDTNNANPTVTINVNGTNIIQQNYDSGSFFSSTNLTFVVPNNQTYSVNTTNGGNIGLWAELR